MLGDIGNSKPSRLGLASQPTIEVPGSHRFPLREPWRESPLGKRLDQRSQRLEGAADKWASEQVVAADGARHQHGAPRQSVELRQLVREHVLNPGARPRKVDDSPSSGPGKPDDRALADEPPVMCAGTDAQAERVTERHPQRKVRSLGECRLGGPRSGVGGDLHARLPHPWVHHAQSPYQHPWLGEIFIESGHPLVVDAAEHHLEPPHWSCVPR